MRNSRTRLRAGLLALALSLVALPGCATNHLIEWSHGRASIYRQPYPAYASYLQPAGLVLAIPITALWDVVTAPFQWAWDVYPYGPRMKPEDQENIRASDQ